MEFLCFWGLNEQNLRCEEIIETDNGHRTCNNEYPCSLNGHMEFHCPVCFKNKFKVEGMFCIGCKKPVCAKCIKKWLCKKNSCPLCRSCKGFTTIQNKKVTFDKIELNSVSDFLFLYKKDENKYYIHNYGFWCEVQCTVNNNIMTYDDNRYNLRPRLIGNHTTIYEAQLF